MQQVRSQSSFAPSGSARLLPRPDVFPGTADELLSRWQASSAQMTDLVIRIMSAMPVVGGETPSSPAGREAHTGPVTTLMVRNIPLDCTQDMLVEAWQNEGTYDFLYLPRTSSGKINLGYAFINFTDEAGARGFRARWHRTGFPGFPRARLSVSIAGSQGQAANINELKAKSLGRLRARQCEPLIFLDGRRVELDEL
mmetsp:Transcript_90891/g.261938  ORF Transcript_90891/g.261938 Transcript_90891/m.261938 type:complete len:197 (-) Transcript_90891:271-861(-)